MARMDRRLSPRPLGREDVLTIAEAARELKLRDADARAWLTQRLLIKDVAGRGRVIWGDVLDALRGTYGDPFARRATMWPVEQTDRFG